MSFTRLTNDKCYHMLECKENRSVFCNQTFKGKYNNNRGDKDFIHDIYNCKLWVDVESDLKGISRISTLCNEPKYPTCTDAKICMRPGDKNIPKYSPIFLKDRTEVSPWHSLKYTK